MLKNYDGPRVAAQLLRRARRARGIKQAHLAELVGVSQSTLSKWESGWAAISEEHYKRLFKILGTAAIGDSDRWLLRLVRHSARQVHLMRESDHRLLAASHLRICEWKREYSDVASGPLSRDLPSDIAAAEQRLNEIDTETRWCVPAVLHVDGREQGVYEIERGLLLWEWVTLSDGELARLVTNINEREIPNQYLRLDAPSGRTLLSRETTPQAAGGGK